jgi:hypothetical protein
MGYEDEEVEQAVAAVVVVEAAVAVGLPIAESLS